MKHSTQAAIFAMAANMLFAGASILTFQLVQTMQEIGSPVGLMAVFAGVGAVFAYTAIIVPIVIINNVAGE